MNFLKNAFLCKFKISSPICVVLCLNIFYLIWILASVFYVQVKLVLISNFRYLVSS